MRVVTFTLTTGRLISFILGNGLSHLVVVENEDDEKTCTIVDGRHNNGGWKIKKPYHQVVKELAGLL